MDYVDLGRMSTESNKRSRKKNRWIKKVVGLLFIALVGLGVFRLFISSTPAVMANFWSTSGTVLSYMLPGSAHIEQDEGVTNFMLVGIDRRASVPYTYQTPQGEVERNGFLADTIIIASLNWETESLSLLSLPRDLWVEIPAFGELRRQYSKINSAHALGDRFSDRENGGMILLKRVVEQTLDVPVHYWARIDFEGFEKGVDAIGGVDVIVERAFDDYRYPVSGCENCPWDQRWEHIHFDQGLQHMDGVTALKYARSRHAAGVEGTDFARAQRQQKVIIAVKNKIVSTPSLFTLTKIKELYGLVSDNVSTNVLLTELPLFFSRAGDFVDKEIDTYSLTNRDNNLLISPAERSLYGNAWVLIPRKGRGDFSEIQEFVKEKIYGAGLDQSD